MLMDQCRAMASACDSSAWRLRMVGQMAPGIQSAMTALHSAKDEFGALATSLHLLASPGGSPGSKAPAHLPLASRPICLTAVAGAAWSGAGKGDAWVASMTGTNDETTTRRSQLRGVRKFCSHRRCRGDTRRPQARCLTCLSRWCPWLAVHETGPVIGRANRANPGHQKPHPN
jgi:hypothetical protein